MGTAGGCLEGRGGCADRPLQRGCLLGNAAPGSAASVPARCRALGESGSTQTTPKFESLPAVRKSRAAGREGAPSHRGEQQGFHRAQSRCILLPAQNSGEQRGVCEQLTGESRTQPPLNETVTDAQGVFCFSSQLPALVVPCRLLPPS